MEYLQLLWEKATSKRESADSAGAREVMKAFQILVSPRRLPMPTLTKFVS